MTAPQWVIVDKPPAAHAEEFDSRGTIFRPSTFLTHSIRRIYFINYTNYFTLYLTGIFYFIYPSEIIIYENVRDENRNKNCITLVFFFFF